MLIQIYKIDKDGFFISDYIAEKKTKITEVSIVDESEEISSQEKYDEYIETNFEYVTKQPPSNPAFIKPKWNGSDWVEGATQEYIDNFTNVVVEQSELDILRDYVLDIELRMILKDLEV